MKVISLYTGAGGLDLGLEAAGFSTAVAVEHDPEACQTLAANVPWKVIQGDIHGVSAAQILKVAACDVGEATLLVGGPPCQPFSKSGFWARGDVRRLGDPRASTIEEFLRILASTKPEAYLLENVPGFGYRRKDEGLRLFRERLSVINQESGRSPGGQVNYSCHVAVLDASDYGVPQRRSRLFVIGHRDGLRSDLANRATIEHATTNRIDRCCWDAIGEWEEDDDPTLVLTGKWADLLPSIPEGSNYQYLTDRGGGEALFGYRRRYWSFLLKLSRSEPSWTITAQPGPATGPFHWRNRRLSSRELAALQTFPRGYRVTGDLRSIQRQLGNAVPSALAEFLGLRIRAEFLGHREVLERPLTLIPKKRDFVPPSPPPQPVPFKYRALVGKHAPHPGTGLGPAAQKRN